MPASRYAPPVGSPSKRIAVVGSGIAGLSAAWLLGRRNQITLYEAGDYLGGHTHTVDAAVGGRTFGVDTGFLVFNTSTYPNFSRLLEWLGVAVAQSEMSFSLALEEPALEWSGTSVTSLFAQRSNLVSPGFMRMLRDILRFNSEATALAKARGSAGRAGNIPIGEFLDEGGYSTEFRDWYLIPMAAAIWSCPTRTMLGFPFPAFARFFHNHGLLKLGNRPQWQTVQGGARRYVAKLAARIADVRLATPVIAVNRDDQGVTVASRAKGAVRSERYDALVLACHTDQALGLLGEDATLAERAVLGAIGYQRNRAVLHTDAALLPANRRVWSAWNYAAGRQTLDGRPASVHYLINKLQPLPVSTPVVVSLNPYREPRADTVIGEYDYAHPVFGLGAEIAQSRLPSMQGLRHTWYCGAWTRYGFHEDGLDSALSVARSFGIEPPWQASTARALALAS